MYAPAVGAIACAVCFAAVASPAAAQAVLFRSTDGYFDLIPGWDHCGLEAPGGGVWECHPGYTNYDIFHCGFTFVGTAWDPDANQRRSVPQIRGVQNQHTTGSFRWNSCSSFQPQQGTFERLLIGSSLASSMEFQIILRQGAGYPILANPYELSPARQKGSEGTFSCVGLIEYAAEQAGYNGGEGFIPSYLEALRVGGTTVTTLTPQILYNAIRQNWHPGIPLLPLRAQFDPVDFVLTDPLGRRAGHSAATGTLREIPGLDYTGDGTVEGFVWTTPLPGRYGVRLTGLGADAFAIIGDGSGLGFVFQGHLASGQIAEGEFFVHGACVADFDDGSGLGRPDGGVTVDDILYFLGAYALGSSVADTDDGSGSGHPDGGVTIDDLLFFLAHYATGC